MSAFEGSHSLPAVASHDPAVVYRLTWINAGHGRLPFNRLA